MSTVAVSFVKVSVLTQLWLFSWAVLAPATSVKVMLFASPKPGVPMAAIVAVPVQLPANAEGIVAPVACAVTDAALLLVVLAALLVVFAALPVWPAACSAGC